MPEAHDYNSYYNEALEAHSPWQDHATEEWAFRNGKQWDDATAQKLAEEKRPHLTLNYLRSLVRLLVGYELRTRYDLKVFPIGDAGDDEVSRLLSGMLKFIRKTNLSEYAFSSVFDQSLTTGRGWIKAAINYDFNILGDIGLTDHDPNEILIDPNTRRLDLLDSRYLIVERQLDKENVLKMYPIKAQELATIPSSFADATVKLGGREFYRVRETWYRKFEDEWYLVKRTGDVHLLKSQEDREQAKEVAFSQPENWSLRKWRRPEMHYAVTCGEEIYQDEPGPYNHPYFPYVPDFCEFLPAFRDHYLDTVGIIRDLIDPQRELNKNRSAWLDILIRTINRSYLSEVGNIINVNKFKREQANTGGILEVQNVEKTKIVEGMAPNPQLMMGGQEFREHILGVSGINPPMLGMVTGSRESGKSISIRQQQGNVMVAPYQDHLRLTHFVTAKIILSLIPQIYSAPRLARIIADDGTVQSLRPEQLRAIQRVLGDIELGKYDVEIGEAPSTPTQRIAEFVELKEIVELMAQLGMPPAPEVLISLVNASDVSRKQELIQGLVNTFKQMAAQPERSPRG